MKGFGQFYRRALPFTLALPLIVVLINFLPGKLYAQSSVVEKAEETTGILPSKELFDPLLADPRWPHFSASYQKYQDDEELDNVGSTNFGVSFALLGFRGLGGEWQLGLQAGVFSIFDLDASSNDLINSDFRVGIPLSIRYGPFSAQAKIFHQSSHLGDEYLLRNRVERIDLSYEAVDLLLSLDLGKIIRIYGGGGNIFHSNPELEKYSIQGGLELTIPYALFGILYPVAAGDFHTFEETDWDNNEETDWYDNYSARAGFEIRSDHFANRRLLIMFEYFNGHSPNGQFFEREIEYYGGGLHFYF